MKEDGQTDITGQTWKRCLSTTEATLMGDTFELTVNAPENTCTSVTEVNLVQIPINPYTGSV